MSKRYYVFNKPTGCVTARTDALNKTVMDYFVGEDLTNLSPVGRLDKDTRGLIFVTDDGKWLQYMTNPESKVRKKYKFVAMGVVDEQRLDEIRHGVSLTGMNGRLTRPASVEIIKNGIFADYKHLVEGNTKDKILKNKDDTPVFIGYVTVVEGRKHEVRRLIKYCNGCIFYLERIMMGEYELDDKLKPGSYRALDIEELEKIKGMENLDYE